MVACRRGCPRPGSAWTTCSQPRLGAIGGDDNAARDPPAPGTPTPRRRLKVCASRRPATVPPPPRSRLKICETRLSLRPALPVGYPSSSACMRCGPCAALPRGESACGPATQIRSLARLPRGEYQVPDQAQQAEREGPAAQQGGQVIAEDLGAQVP